MTFKNDQCPVCGRLFTDEDDIVVCPECGTPHHRACWEQYGHCANRARHGSYQYVNTAPPEEEKEASREDPRTVRMPDWVCKSCGRENPPDRDDCEYCGAARPFLSRAQMVMIEPDVVPPNTAVDGIPVDELKQYIGPGAPKYLFRFVEMDKRQSKVSWNWGAALFGPLWCFYRKIYSVGLLYLLVGLVLAVICIPAGFGDYVRGVMSLLSQMTDPAAVIEYVSENAPSYAPWQEMLINLFRIGGSILLGLFGNHLYRGKVKRSVLQIRTQASDMETYRFLLAKKGRVSILMPILAAIFSTYGQTVVLMGFAMLLGR